MISYEPDVDAGLSVRANGILEAAERLIEDTGWQNMSLRGLAEVLSMRAPSLYKHFRSKNDLKAHIVQRQLVRMGRRLRPVTKPGNIDALMNAYRTEAAQSPEAYRLATSGPLDRASLPAGLEDWVGDCFIVACYGNRDLAQAVWAASHGAVILDLDTRFESGAIENAAWNTLVECLDMATKASLSPH